MGAKARFLSGLALPLLSGAFASAITIALGGTQISSDGNLVFRTNGSTTALTLDTSQNATFVGTVTPGTGTAIDATHGGTAQTTWTTGDLLYASNTNVLSKLGAGTATHVLTANGAGVAPSWQAAAGGGGISVLDRVVTTTTVTTTATETNIYSYSVAGGTLSTNVGLRLTIFTVGTFNFGDTITIKAYYGATIFGGAQLFGGVAGDHFFKIEALLSGHNATNAQSGCLVPLGVVGGTFSGPTGANVNTLAEDSTAAKTLKVTVQFSSNSAGDSISAYSAFLEKLN